VTGENRDLHGSAPDRCRWPCCSWTSSTTWTSRRDYELFVPRDCCASNEATDDAFALMQMEKVLKADLRPSAELDLERMRGRVPA